MHQNNQQLNEGLRPFDLEDMVDPLLEIDTYKSKMGEDRDVCVVTFRVKDRNPAKDVMEFVEKGFDFVLDADVSSGENKDGNYFVFVELSRSPRLAEQIKDITYGMRRLTGIDDWKFTYHKESRKKDLSSDSLNEMIPTTPQNYDQYLNRLRTESIKSFFNKTLMDDLTLEDNTIVIHKPYNQKYYLEIMADDSREKVVENIASLALDNTAMGEIFWLTKIFGDYNINKVQDGFVFENGDRAMILKRIEK
jgi:hypothetical protein